MAISFPVLTIRSRPRTTEPKKITLILPSELKKEESSYRLQVALPTFLGGVATAATGTALLFTCGNRLIQPGQRIDQQNSACEASSYSLLGLGSIGVLTGAALFAAPSINRALEIRRFLKSEGLHNVKVQTMWNPVKNGLFIVYISADY